MISIANILAGISTAFQIQNILYALLGTALGIAFGAMPGLSASMGVAVLIPLSYGMDPASGLILLASVYCGATYGGSISAILVNTPGTPAAAATAADGNKMALHGHAMEALTESAVASFWGGTLSVFALLFLAPPLASFSLKFGPQERFMLAVFGLTIIASLTSKNIVKGLIGGFLGLLIGCVGMDPKLGSLRYTFGIMNLYTGIPLVPALIGIYSISQVFAMIKKQGTVQVDEALKEVNHYRIHIRDLFYNVKAYIICGIVGIIVGIIPGAGGSIAAFLGYDTARRLDKHPERFGTGYRNGVSGPESANNGVTGGAMIPMLTLGIPGNAVTAILMGGLAIQGLTPGNGLFTDKAYIIYPFIIGLFIANFFMLLMGLFGSKYFAKVNKLPQNFLATGILVLTVVGAYAVHNSFTEIYIMLAFGMLGYFLRSFKFDLSPVVLGMILGPIAEKAMSQAAGTSHGYLPALASCLTRPICIVLIALSVVSVVGPIWSNYKAAKNGQTIVEEEPED